MPFNTADSPLTRKEIAVLNFIRTYHSRHGVCPTYAEIQNALDYKAISSIQQFVAQLVGKGYLKAPLGSNRKRGLELSERESADMIEIPLEGKVAAGRLTAAVQNRERIAVPKYMLRSGVEYFALRIKGDSMAGDCILDGDLVVIRRQATAQNGQTVVALVDDEATIKRFRKTKTHIELHPANPHYEVIRIEAGRDCQILGILSSVIRQLE
jgi:repressor LexA